MKKFLLLILVAMTAFGVNAQTRKGEGSLMGSLGYQTNYERFGLQAQGRYVIANNLRIAPDLTFFFPKDKATGLDVNVNFHYVFNFRLSSCGNRYAEQLLWKAGCRGQWCNHSGG